MEKLIGMSDYDLFCSYSMLEGPMPLWDYMATLRLTPLPSARRSMRAEFTSVDAAAEAVHHVRCACHGCGSLPATQAAARNAPTAKVSRLVARCDSSRLSPVAAKITV